MDAAVIGFITLMQDYPMIGFVIALVMFGLLFLLKKKLLILMQPPQELNKD